MDYSKIIDKYYKYLEGIDLENVDISSILMKPMTLQEICEVLNIKYVYQNGYRDRQLEAINRIFILRKWGRGQYILTKLRSEDKDKARYEKNKDPRFQIPYEYRHCGGRYAITIDGKVEWVGRTNDYARLYKEIMCKKSKSPEAKELLNIKGSAFISTEPKYQPKSKKSKKRLDKF